MAVGIVIISHSTRLAEGVVELAGQMAQGDIKLVAAGGTDDGSLGTSINKVNAALQQAAGPEGVLILLDLGSAAMITEIAVESLSEEQRQLVIVSSAPLVEGAVLAAVEAASGSTLSEVAEAAMQGAAMPKGQQA